MKVGPGGKLSPEEVWDLCKVPSPEVTEQQRALVAQAIIASKIGPVDRDAIHRDVQRLSPRHVADLYRHYVESKQTRVL